MGRFRLCNKMPVASSIAMAAWSSCCCWKQEQWQQQEATEGLNDNSEEKAVFLHFLPEEEDNKPAENPHMTFAIQSISDVKTRVISAYVTIQYGLKYRKWRLRTPAL